MNNIDKRIEELELKKEQIENEIQKLVSIKELEQFKKSIKEVKTNSDNIDLFDLIFLLISLLNVESFLTPILA